MAEYLTFVPSDAKRRTFSDTTQCKGCSMVFPCYKRQSRSGSTNYPAAFYIHCVEECEGYKKLDLIRNCDTCMLAFYSPQLYAYHMRNVHRTDGDTSGAGSPAPAADASPMVDQQQPPAKRVKLEAQSILIHNRVTNVTVTSSPSTPTSGHLNIDNYQIYKAAAQTEKSNDQTDCDGCGLALPCFNVPGQNIKYSDEFFRHCIRECKDYKRLGLIRHCHECRHSFLNPQHFEHHRGPCNERTSQLLNQSKGIGRRGGRFGSLLNSNGSPQHPKPALTPTNNNSNKPQTTLRVVPPKLHPQPAGSSLLASKNQNLPPPPLSRPMQVTTSSSSPTKLVIRKLKAEPAPLPAAPSPAGSGSCSTGGSIYEAGTDINMDEYIVYTGRDHNRHFDDRVECKGCGKSLPCWGKNSKHRKYSPEYYMHCVKECEPYKKLGLIRHCPSCKHLFVSPNMFNKHICNLPLNGFDSSLGDADADLASSFDDAFDGSEFDLSSLPSPQQDIKEEQDDVESNGFPMESLVIEPDIILDEQDHLKDDDEVINPNVDLFPAVTYRIHIPEASLVVTNFPHRVSCQGCTKKLPCFNETKDLTHYSPEYYRHCCDDCVAYRRLGQIEHCAECKLIFDSAKNYEEHLDIVHGANSHLSFANGGIMDEDMVGGSEQAPLPITNGQNGKIDQNGDADQAPDTSDIPIFNSDEFEISYKPNPNIDNWPDTTSCKGCSKEFKCKISADGKIYYPDEFFTHCIKDCGPYKNLDLIRHCFTCKYSFVNVNQWSVHNALTHPDPIEDNDTLKPYMPRETRNTKARVCEGCGRSFSYNATSCKMYSYYVHCIMDCTEYRKLGLVRVCHTCKSLFINPGAYDRHVCR